MGTLDEKLMPIDTPVTSSGAVTPYDFAGGNERGVMGAFNIKTFNFSQGSGGTLTMGGTLNGNGQIVIKDSNGSTISAGGTQGLSFYNTVGTESIRIDLTGFHAYGSTGGTELVRVDNTGFHAYGTAGTSTELVRVDRTGLHGYLASGTKTIDVGPSGLDLYGNNGDSFNFRTTGSVAYGQIGAWPDYPTAGRNSFFLGNPGTAFEMYQIGNRWTAYGASGTGVAINISAPIGTAGVNITAAGNVDVVAADFKVNGVSKAAIVKTYDGYKELYCIESPEVWFVDFCESKDKIDPLFLEATVKPYRFVKCEDDDGKELYQVWGRRKGHEKKRFEPKTEDQFNKNYEFWSKPL